LLHYLAALAIYNLNGEAMIAEGHHNFIVGTECTGSVELGNSFDHRLDICVGSGAIVLMHV